MDYFDLIGWAGSFLLTCCVLPQLLHTIRTKETAGLSVSMLGIWLAGLICTTAYLLSKTPILLPPTISAGFNSIVVTIIIILYFKYRSKS